MKIIYEHPDFLIVEKAQGTPVQAKKMSKETIVSQIESYLEFKKGIEDPFIGMVHRLDQPTGGLMLFARTPKALKILNNLMTSHGIQKSYYARVEGEVTRGKAVVKHFLVTDQKNNLVTAYDHPVDDSKEAILSYEVIEIQADKNTLLKVTLETGRQHQIRAQLSAIGHPIVGDMKYGSSQPDLPLNLWSSQLSFKYKGKAFDFKSQPPFM